MKTMKLTDSEWQIMNALWKHHPATAREVKENLPGTIHWAYTTIKTLLTRLVAKNAVSERKRGNTSLYEPLVTRSRARRSAISSLLNQAFDGTVEPLVHFIVEDRHLSEKQRKKLIEILREEARKGREEK
jgi:BlaI family penicillinase repressor